MDRREDGDNCGYCVTGGRKEGRKRREGGRQPSSRQTEKDSLGTTDAFVAELDNFETVHLDAFFSIHSRRWRLLKFIRRRTRSYTTTAIIVTIGRIGLGRVVAVICRRRRRHVWLVFRICRRRLVNAQSQFPLPPTICRAVMVDMGRSPFRIPHPL